MRDEHEYPELLEMYTATRSWLHQHPGAVKVHEDGPGSGREGATHAALSAWESAHQQLPDDVRAFYLMSDGLSICWDVVAHGREIVPLGSIAINSLLQLNPVEPGVLRDERGALRHELPAPAASASAVGAFDLDLTCETGRVLLVLGLEGPRRAQVWFQDASCMLSRVSCTFSEYFRLLVLHLGLPRWQYAYTDTGLDPTCRQWLRLLAPDRLQQPVLSTSVAQGAACATGLSAAASAAASPASARASIVSAVGSPSHGSDAKRAGSGGANGGGGDACRGTSGGCSSHASNSGGGWGGDGWGGELGQRMRTERRRGARERRRRVRPKRVWRRCKQRVGGRRTRLDWTGRAPGVRARRASRLAKGVMRTR